MGRDAERLIGIEAAVRSEALVSKRCRCSRSTFSEPNKVSPQASTQQFPLRLTELAMSYAESAFPKSWLACWLPRSLPPHLPPT